MSNKIKKKQLKQIQNQAQDGRSMVEMLGVLAIVGVLSIGGIAGYSWGMDKHVANQILNEMNLNSLQLAMLLQKGNPDGVTLSLGSPYDDENPTFSTVNYGFDYGCGENDEEHTCDPNETMYSITAIGLPKRVCNMLNDSVLDMAYYYNHTINGRVDNECDDNELGNTVTVFFDTDTTIDGEISRSEEPETHTPMPEVTEPTTTTTTTEATTPTTTTTEAATTTQATTTTTQQTNCPTGTTWNDTEKECECSDGKHLYGNQCVTCDESTGGTWDEENKECTCKEEGKYWSDSAGECIENPCNSCADDEFCLSSDCNTCSIDGGDGRTTEVCSTHSCKKISEYKAENKDTENPDRYIMSKSSMNWWSAERFCKALPGNRHMVTFAELNCCNQNLGVGGTRYCYAKGETCSMSNGLSDVIKALSKAETGTETKGNKIYWLYDPFTSTNAGRNSCGAYTVYLHNSYFDYARRNSYKYANALCE